MTDADPAVGKGVPRSNARRLVAGRGRFTDDIQLARMVHVAFVRSPYAHARIVRIDGAAAARAPGVVRVVTGAEIAAICTPWSGTASHVPTLRSPPQYPMAVERAVWQGEPVAAVVAATRAEAEDAAEAVAVEYLELPVVADPVAALEGGAALVHPELGSNLAFETEIVQGDAGAALDGAETVVECALEFGRHTGVPLEPRALIAEFDPGERTLTVHNSHQSPWQQQDVYARHLGIAEHDIRVIAPDVGGAFGTKLHVYGEDVATVAISMLLGRPVKYTADRLESFVADMHARDHRVKGRMGVAGDGTVRAMEVEALGSVGAYSAYRRVGIGEGMMAIGVAGAPYAFTDYRGRLAVAFQNKTPLGVYRAVGQPIACAITEQLIDDAAAAVGLDPVELRRRNYIADDAYPWTTPGRLSLERLSLHQCLDKLVRMMDYEGLRAEQARLREDGIIRGIGIATFVELTAASAYFYGPAEARISSQDGCTLRLEPSGKLRCVTSITDQGQGTWTGIAQIVADRFGVGVDDVRIVAGDTATAPYGGGAWASRQLTVGGEAAYAAASALRDNVLALAAAIVQAEPDALDLAGGEVRDRATGETRMTLAEISEIGHFRHDTLPPDIQPELSVTRNYAPMGRNFAVANGIQGSWLEVDVETGFITLLEHWVVEDCGRIINPLLVDEQIRGGVVQGIGGALFEHCRYDDAGQLLNGTLADYLVPMAAEMPDIHIAHVETLAQGTALGAKGTGEAGTAGAPAAVLCAVNDALRPLGARVGALPITPEHVLAALGLGDGAVGGGALNRS